MRVECLTCHGTYDTLLSDGTLYFHRCPPLSVAELRAALEDGTVTLSAADAVRLATAQAADAKTPPTPDQIAHVDLVLGSIVVERPFTRDENVTAERNAQGHARVKAIGKGVKLVP